MPAPWTFGFARRDITTFEPEIAMLGWGQYHNRVGGVAEPLYARALYLAQTDGPGRLAYVCCDLLLISEALRAAVVERLSVDEALGVGEHEIVLTATHTHSGPSGYSHYFWKNIASPGYSPVVFDALVEGLVESVREAARAAVPGRIRLVQGALDPAEPIAFNRAWRAYNLNEDVEPVSFERRHRATDPTMTVLRFDAEDADDDDRPLGVVCWYALHGTCVHSDNRLMHPDHKGLAAHALEATDGGPRFAIFAQEAAGDTSPNYRWDRRRGVTVGRYDDDFESAAHVARVQARRAAELVAGARHGRELTGPLQTVVRYVDFAAADVDPQVDGRAPGRSTWPARMGVSMAMGTAEGPGPLGPHPGLTRTLNALAGGVHKVRARLQPGYARDHDPKWPLLDMWRGTGGRLGGLLPLSLRTLPPLDPALRYTRELLRAEALTTSPFMPHVLPVQLVRIGPLALAATSFEVTTVSGWRLRATLTEALGAVGVDTIVINPYANAYSGYLTTFEEYQAQGYEGGYTLFGPHSLAAVRTAFKRLAAGLGSQARDPGERPAAIAAELLARQRYTAPWSER